MPLGHDAATIRPPWAHLRIPPFPKIAMRVMQMAGDADVSMRQLSDLISTDSAFSSEVLTIANSALFSSRVPIHSVLQAVAMLGTNTLRGVCLTVGVRAYLGSAISHHSLRAVWRHSLACGLIAEQLAVSCSLDKNTAFSTGVLHDIGRMALAVLMPKEYAALLATHKGTPASILDRERDLCGFDHCEAGLQLISNWNLPVDFRAVVADHHNCPPVDGSWGFPDLIRVSCRLADTLGFAVFPGCVVDPYPDLVTGCTASERKTLPENIDNFTFEISSKINAVELAS